jgi:hypothetical protein
VFDCYTRVVGDALRARTMPERLAGTTLFVRATTSAIAHELTLLRGDILERMARRDGSGHRAGDPHARRPHSLVGDLTDPHPDLLPQAGEGDQRTTAITP